MADEHTGPARRQKPTLRFWLFIALSAALAGVTLWLNIALAQREGHLATLRQTDPEGYLTALKHHSDRTLWPHDRERWLEELKHLAPGEYAAELARAEAEADHKRRYGFHCLESWFRGGRHPGFTKAVIASLAAPDGFEHIETIPYPVDAQGRNRIVMTYRIQNGLDGTHIARASGTFSNRDCSVRVLSLE